MTTGHIRASLCFFFFFNDTATTEIYTLSLHDALPISSCSTTAVSPMTSPSGWEACRARDRKSTRLNSSHVEISYAVFCLKKKKKYSATGTRPACCPDHLKRNGRRVARKRGDCFSPKPKSMPSTKLPSRPGNRNG